MQWYGGTTAAFRSIGSSFLALSSIVRGSTQFIEAMSAISRDFTVVFVTSFFVVVSLFIHAALLATLNGAYISVRRKVFHYDPTNAQDYEMTGFLMKRLKRWLGFTKPKPVNYHIHLSTEINILFK